MNILAISFIQFFAYLSYMFIILYILYVCTFAKLFLPIYMFVMFIYYFVDMCWHVFLYGHAKWNKIGLVAAHKGNVKSDFAWPCEIFAQSCATLQEDENEADGLSTSHHHAKLLGARAKCIFSICCFKFSIFVQFLS